MSLRARSRSSPLVAGGVVLGGLALVALATSGARSGGGPDVSVGDQRWLNNLHASVVVLLYGAAIALWLIALAARRRDRGQRVAHGWRERLVMSLHLLLPTIVTVVALIALTSRPRTASFVPSSP